ncbi:4-phosphopantetheinyl transferase, partial [Xanthomonas oryzae pv. oryzae]
MTAHASWRVGPVQLWLRPHRHG